MKGQIFKQEIIQKILSTFNNSFLYNGEKEIRINGMENGEPVQIKVTLTASKTIVEAEDGDSSFNTKQSAFVEEPAAAAEKKIVSQEEQQNIEKMLEALGL